MSEEFQFDLKGKNEQIIRLTQLIYNLNIILSIDKKGKS